VSQCVWCSAGLPVMECVGWGARLWEGADTSTFICFLLSFFLPRCGLAGAATGTTGAALAKAEGRPRLGLPGVCLCHPACKSPLHFARTIM